MSRCLKLFPTLLLAGGSLVAQEPALRPGDLPRLPAVEPANVASTFRVKQGYRMELVAAEPLVMDPVAMCFDEDGRLFVIEMRDYSERRDERLGRIKMLEDTDQDGRMDKSTIFAADLPWPTALFWYGGGLIVASTPDVFYFRDTNADGVSDSKELLFTGFASEASRINMQQLVNSFNWGLDNRIHGANGGNPSEIKSIKSGGDRLTLRGRDFSIQPGDWSMLAESGGAQHGMSFDGYGRKFVCSNSSHIQQVLFDQWQLEAVPGYSWPSALLDIAVDGSSAEVFRVSPEEPWRVLRTKWRVTGLVQGIVEGGGRASGYFTSATGLTIYKGDALGEDFVGDAFVADCGSNLIHHKKVRENGVAFLAERPADEQRSEFIASTDTWFRPVQFANAPDGALYVADMYREVIEHPWSIPPNLKSLIDLNSGSDRGRIYRIVPENFKHRAAPRLSKVRTSALVDLLDHPNGWHRETAARLLFERQDKVAIRPLKRKVKDPKSKWGRLHSIYALQGMEELDAGSLSQALTDSDPGVRENAIKLLRVLGVKERSKSDITAVFPALANDGNPRVRFAFASVLTTLDFAQKEQLLALLLKNARDPHERTVMLAASMNQAAEVMQQLFAMGGKDLSTYSELARLTATHGNKNEAQKIVALIPSIATDEQGQVVLLGGVAKGLDAGGDSITDVLGKERSLKIVERVSAKIDQRLTVSPEEVHLLARLTSDPALLAKVFSPAQSEPAHRAALENLARIKSRESSEAVFSNWGTIAPSLKQFALQLFSANAAHVKSLLSKVQDGTITVIEIPVAVRNSLRSQGGVAVEILGKAESATRAEALARYRTALTLHGNAGRGKPIYVERCASCHKVAGQGVAVGPDLESVRQAGRETLLANIIDPNREVSSRYVSYEVFLKDGEAVSGVVASESPSEIFLRAANGIEHRVSRSNISALKNSGRSLMPEGLEEGLDAQTMADLLEYILRGE